MSEEQANPVKKEKKGTKAKAASKA